MFPKFIEIFTTLIALFVSLAVSYCKISDFCIVVTLRAFDDFHSIIIAILYLFVNVQTISSISLENVGHSWKVYILFQVSPSSR